MRKISQEEIKTFNPEQIASVILKIMQEIKNGERNVSYAKSLDSLISFEIVPIWLGKNVKDGTILYENGAVSTYAGNTAPQELQLLFDEAIDVLKKECLIKKDPEQDSDEFIILTNKGSNTQINDKFELNIKRETTSIIESFKSSVFIMETIKDDVKSCGTCFVLEGSILVTCEHNVKERKFTIYLDKDTPLNDGMFEVKNYSGRDIALLMFKSNKFKDLLKAYKQFEIDTTELQMGEQLITMGYPKIPQRYHQLLSDVGTFQNYTEDYYKKEFITLSNKIEGGCSGGPIISLYGKLVGIMTELTEESSSTDAEKNTKNIFNHGIPAKYIHEAL